MDDGIIKHSQRTNPWFPAPGRRRSQAAWGRTTRRGWLPPPLVESGPLWREKIESEILTDLLLQTWPQRYELRRRGRPSRGSSSAWIASFFRKNFINTWIRKVDKWYQWMMAWKPGESRSGWRLTAGWENTPRFALHCSSFIFTSSRQSCRV